MGAKQFVSELVEGMRVDSAFVVRAREIRAARTGEAYLTLDLADRTGRISGVLFRPDAQASAIPTGTVVVVRGTVTRFRGSQRLSVDSLRPASTWDRHEMVASASRPRSELIAELRGLVGSVGDKALGRLLRTVFGDAEFFGRFSECPGSQSHHHAYLGGLLEHTVRVGAHALQAAGTYEGVDADLLVSAALLHDIGKVDELEFDTAIDYSDRGRLVGHVVLGAQRVHEAAVSGGLDADVLSRLEHAILSHHGELEWGSPKRPSTVEALLLHHLDNLDAKTAGFLEALHGATLVEEQWTDAFNLFRRPLYAPTPAEDDRPRVPEEDSQYRRKSA